MPLSCGGRKQRGGKAGRGCCCHFHVHYHLPRRVCAFSFLRLFPRFSQLSFVLIPPVLFFAVLAFVVSFVWFTLLYFIASLLKKDNNHESCKSKDDNIGRASDVDKRRRADGGQERNMEAKAVKHVAELLTGDSATAEVCVKRLEIKEVHVDGFSAESRDIPRLASSDACLNCEVHTNDDKLVQEVIIFETNREELNANAALDGYPERHRVQDVPIDRFVEELNIREVSTSGLSVAFLVENKQNMVVPSSTSSHHNAGDKYEEYGEEFVDDRKELLACTSSEICDYIDKHETREQVLDGFANDDNIGQLTSSDVSNHDGIRDEHKKDMSNLSEVLFIEANREQIVGTSDEVQDFTNEKEASGLSLDSVCEDENGTAASSNALSHHCVGGEDDKDEELIKNNIVEASGTASVVCDFAENHQTTREVLDGFANDDGTGEVASPESSVLERIRAKDDKINDNRTSMGAPGRLPLVRRSPAPWWNLCGVADVFAGCED